MNLEFRRIDYIVLVVADLDLSLSFYRDTLGMKLSHRSGQYAQFATGNTRFALFQRDAMAETLGYAIDAPAPHRPGFELGFKTPDVDGVYAQLTALGVKGVTPPTTRPWGQRTAYIADPDLHLVELAQDLPRT